MFVCRPAAMATECANRSVPFCPVTGRAWGHNTVPTVCHDKLSWEVAPSRSRPQTGSCLCLSHFRVYPLQSTWPSLSPHCLASPPSALSLSLTHTFSFLLHSFRAHIRMAHSTSSFSFILLSLLAPIPLLLFPLPLTRPLFSFPFVSSTFSRLPSHFAFLCFVFFSFPPILYLLLPLSRRFALLALSITLFRFISFRSLTHTHALSLSLSLIFPFIPHPTPLPVSLFQPSPLFLCFFSSTTLLDFLLFVFFGLEIAVARLATDGTMLVLNGTGLAKSKVGFCANLGVVGRFSSDEGRRRI
ncbi:unnamed protein product [Protopolystoma xenopodis]|uniref:Uncharacterized protein n=1 Tax=Protopolystoma xenopodis TaxID=117903 RepID=A0A3S5ALH3_9PLAT|nr:unnamed protein product [Protopolystoma xenopodis]